MATVLDVAAFIESKLGAVSAYKLQKLVYYAQAWSLAWDQRPLFTTDIEAWKDGPVSPVLWRTHKSVGSFAFGDPSKLNLEEAATVQAVLSFYGPLSAKSLIELTHRESPWRDARRGCPARAPSDNVISLEAMRAYYGPVAQTNPKRVPPEVARGIDLLLSVPEDEVDDLLVEDDVDAGDVMQWLESGGADPWTGAQK